jgi:ABC-type lipoprotein export system ATPase subunit
VSELLRLAGVSKSYRRGSQDLCVLNGVNLEVGVGEIVCVLANHNAGKTTLLRIAAGMDRADTGDVSFEGQNLAALSGDDLARVRGERIAWAGKRGPRTGVRMFDYVCNPLLARAGASPQAGGNWIGRWRERRAYLRGVDARVEAALERVGADGCAEQRWETLSDWERALVEIAHGVAGEPALLLVDDVADSLGKDETKDFIRLLRSISKERQLAVLMSVSDANATLLSDRIVRLVCGRLEESPQRAPAPSPPPSAGNVLEFPDPASQRREAGRASSSNT